MPVTDSICVLQIVAAAGTTHWHQKHTLNNLQEHMEHKDSLQIHPKFVYHFMRGLLEIAQEAPFRPLEKKTGTLLRFYIILTLVTQIISLLIFIPHNLVLFLAPIILVLAIVSFIVEIMLLVLIRQFRSKTLDQDIN